jgi:hypothetical protein
MSIDFSTVGFLRSLGIGWTNTHKGPKLPEALAKYLDKLIREEVDIDKDEPKLIGLLLTEAESLAQTNISIKLKAMKALYKNVDNVSGSYSEDEMKRVQLMQ